MSYLNESFVSNQTFLDNASREHISIAWKQLNYNVTLFPKFTPKKKPILKNLTGYFLRGTLNGLMGPSGAGKTTLLNCLSGNTNGNVNLNIYAHTRASTSCFIEQHVQENIVHQMTVQQILQYAFALKNSNVEYSSKCMQFQIESTLNELMLDQQVLDRYFGDCSGGEQKRIAIAQELMSLEKPSFLFVDEPTTGLDSAAAFEVMKCLKKLTTKHGITVIASIHVPNNETLSLFDKVYVLAKSGVCIYSGAPGQIGRHLQDKCQLQIRKEQPPIECLIKIACEGITNYNALKLEAHTIATELASISSHLPYFQPIPTGLPITLKRFTFSDFTHQTSRLFNITFITNYRKFLSLIGMSIVYLLLLRSFFDSSMVHADGCASKVHNNNSTCVNDLQEYGLLREMINFQSYVLLYTGIIISCSGTIWFASIVKVFRSEHRNGWYSLGSFFWSYILVSFLEMTLYALIIGTCSYFLSSLHLIDVDSFNWHRFALFLLFVWIFSLLLQSFGQLVGAILVEHVEFAVILCLICNCSMLLMNGIFVDVERTQNVLISRLSQMLAVKYVSYGLMQSIYGLDRCDWNTQNSIIVQFYLLDFNAIPEYIARLLLNIIIFRLLTLAVMLLKFGNLSINLFSGSASAQLKPEIVKQNAFDNNNNAVCLAIQPFAISNQLSFQNFKNKSFDKKIIFAWKNLTLHRFSSAFKLNPTPQSATKNPIFCQLNGQIHFGSLNALMGPSGAGKTSLLKVINGKCKTRLDSSSQFYLSRTTQITTCFVTQDVSAHLMAGMTAQQLLYYASRLKNADQTSDIDHEGNVRNILEELGLSNTANTKVENCSGGERKRLALATELTAKVMPNLICIDEPTSGLDSTSAEIVIACLHKLTRIHNLAIITSIHQPTSDCLKLFDQLYVLARGGVCIYSGAQHQIVDHLSKMPEIKRIDYCYPIETLIKEACSNWESPTVQQLAERNTQNCNLHVEIDSDTVTVPGGLTANRSRFSLHSSSILLRRYCSYFTGHLWFEWMLFLGNYLFYGFLLRFVFNRNIIYASGCINLAEDDLTSSNCTRSQEEVDEVIMLVENFKYNFFFAIFYEFYIVLQFALNFAKEFKYFKAEHSNGWYSSGSFYLMKTIVDLVPLMTAIALYVAIGDWLEPIRPGIYLHFLYVFILSSLAFQSIGHIFALLSYGKTSNLIYLTVTIFTFLSLLSNFLLPHSRLHYVYQFISNFAPNRWLFTAIMILQYGFGNCQPNETNQLLYSLNVTDDDYQQCIAMLVLNIVIYRALAFYILVSRVKVNDITKTTKSDSDCKLHLNNNLGVYNY